MTVLSIDSASEFVGTAMGPLVERFSDDTAVRSFVAELGFDALPSVPPVFGEIHDSALLVQDSIANLVTARLDGDSSGAATATAAVTTGLIATIGNLKNLGNSLTAALPSSYVAVTGIDAALERRIVDYILIQAISASQMARAVLITLGVIEENRLDADATKFQPAFKLREFRLDRLSRLFSDPTGLLEDVYGWGTPEIKRDRLFRSISQLSIGLLLPAEIDFPSATLLASMFPGVPDDAAVGRMLNIPATGVLEVGIFPAPKVSPMELQGIAARLIGTPSTKISFGIGGGLEAELDVKAALDTGLGVLFKPDADPQVLVGVESASSVLLSGGIDLTVRRAPAKQPLRVFSFGNTGTLDLTSYHVSLGLEASPSDVVVSAGVDGGRLTISLGEADGFLQSQMPQDGLHIDFDLGVGWSSRRGIFVTGSAGLETVIALNLTLGPVFVHAIRLALRVDDQGLRGQAGVEAGLLLGPITAIVQGIGVEAALKFESGNLGPMDLGVRFLPPTGVGIAIDAGAVKGGGFLAFDFDAGRYSGVIELQVFSVSVKAFGLLETKFPDGTKGYSFVIVIIAEFVPIQLGFGFTLLGIGGLIGVNRTMDETALAAAVRTGSLANLLFPLNPIQDAPAIINDLATVFPAAPGHYLFGPMAKLGWGTPTLISADLGIILEFPGPRIAVLGVVRMLLPSPDAAIVRFQLAVAGILDFPAQTFSLLASLFDSTVAGYVVTGDMAYRLGFGNNPSFLLSVGGFNAGFQSPPAFPTLRRASVDLGVSGNPSLTASGYFAITSNTAQIGASIQLKASGFGIRLDGWLGFDVLFVFSPFSFTASISAGVRVSFHGVGFGITLRGSLSGPTPWHVNGRVCVSILWWDACLPIDVKFGRAEPAALPEIDPWDGDESAGVIGLRAAIENTGNWAGSPPPGGLAVVALSAAATAATTPVDPVGAATLRQKVAPLNMVLEKFGEYKPAIHDQFHLSATRGSVSLNLTPVTEIGVVEDKFAPAHYLQLSSAQRLSMPSYDDMDAGISIAPDRVRPGSMESRTLEYVTKFIDAQGETHDDNEPRFRVTQDQLKHFLERSAAALGGVRRSGIQRYMHPGRDKKISLRPPRFVVADACSLTPNNDITATGTTRTQALLALRAHLQNNPQDRGRFTIAPAA